MELLAPVDRVGEEEVAHLGPAEVEDVAAPLLVPAALGVGVLVERGAVEAGQGPLVGREVARHPVQDDADAGLVQAVDEQPEAVGVAEAAVGREVRRHVVAPGAAEGVLHHRHQLDVGEAEVLHVGDQVGGQLVPRPGAAVVVAAPRREVQLVDAHRGADRRGVGTGGHPLLVAPGVVGGEDLRGGARGGLGPLRQRVGLLAPVAVLAQDRELVRRPRPHAGHEQLPHAGGPELPHRVGAAVPGVGVAGQPDPAGRRRPHREGGAVDRPTVRALVGADVGAQDGPQLLVASLVDQVQVDLAEGGQEAVGVLEHQRPAVVGDRQAVVGDLGGREHTDPHALVLVGQRDLPELTGHADPGGQRSQDADRDCAVVRVRTQDGVRVAVLAADELVELLDGHRTGCGGAGGGHAAPISATACSGISTQVGRLRVS